MNKVDDSKLVSQFYLVVFIDILGQRESLRNITFLPGNDQEKERFYKHLKDTLGKVITLRDLFDTFFNGIMSRIPKTDLVPPEHRQAFLASQKTDLHSYGISDSIIISVPLSTEKENENCTPMNGVYAALVATACLGLSTFARRIIWRAGLDVGICTQIKGMEIYGPALERAFYLESQLAEYPRFVIGDVLIQYLSSIREQECRTPFGQIAKNMANFCREMIIQDTDGRYMLDFLGKRSKEMFDKAGIGVEDFTLARDFIISEYERYSKENNHKLASRYYRLMSYFNFRQELWES
jgi:hypothetical protein